MNGMIIPQKWILSNFSKITGMFLLTNTKIGRFIIESQHNFNIDIEIV